MSTITVIAGTTSAVVTQVPFSTNGQTGPVSFSAFGLAGAEEIVPYIGGSGGWTAIYDTAGAQVKLTATKPQLALQPGAHYGFTKSATAGAAGLDAIVTG